MVSPRACVLSMVGLACVCASNALPAAEIEMPSCVEGSPPLRLSANAERAVLDRADANQMHHAAQLRYPIYHQYSALAPAQVLMVRRGTQWVYMTVRAQRGHSACVEAVFAADRFDFTAGWLTKYAPRAPDRDD